MKAENVNSFVVGDRVSWTSQAAGSQKTKMGTIVEVVPPHTQPHSMIRDHGATRRECSYVVEVAAKGRGASKLYWPRVKGLKETGPLNYDLLEELIEEGERRSPGFRAQVEAAYVKRRAARGVR